MKKWIGVLLVVVVTAAFGQAWFIETVDSAIDVGQYSSLAIDSENKPHIAYFDADSAFLKYATWNGATWDIEVADDNSSLGGVGMYSSLALGPLTERPQIAYYDIVNTHLKWANLNVAGDWIVGIPDPSTTNDVGQGCDIVIGEQAGDEIPQFSYYDATAGYLMYARFLGTVWARDTVDSVGPLPTFGTDMSGTSITLDPSGNPHIAYYAWDVDSTTGYLKYAHLVSGEWAIDTVELIWFSDLGWWPDIVINEDEGNVPYISYYDAGNGYFKYARWNMSAWAIDIIDNTPGVGLYGAQVLGSTYASYYDSSNADLKYAYSDNYMGWHTESVDTTGAVGSHTSIALSRKGEINFPHISYYDATNGNLKYATKIIKDVLPTEMWLDTLVGPNIHPDSSYTPKANVFNQGNTVATFDVHFDIFYSGLPTYTSVVTIGPLAAEEEAVVVFDPWSAPHYEDAWYYMKVYTALPDDSLFANDTLEDSIYCALLSVAEPEIVPVRYALTVSGSAVELAIPALTDADVYVLDVAGRRRLTLHQGNLAAGVHRFSLDESVLPNGVYFIKFEADAANLTRKTVLVR